ncbi:hypothetical protein VNO78_14542 [Psophocarpus tetragonolobus]|uniref:Uncharacterized protein n=1 Tax=Psophocarpus tetragonolobus TaxID=3891 RepID=A0AAN9ST20_PSOTE
MPSVFGTIVNAHRTQATGLQLLMDSLCAALSYLCAPGTLKLTEWVKVGRTLLISFNRLLGGSRMTV